LRVGILGGSFDPVHAGHLHVARAAQRAFALDRVVFVPAARPPHKPGQLLASGLDRTTMLEIALERDPSFLVSTIELERAGPSFTIDTVRALPAELGLPADVELFLLIGGDNLPDLPAWREAGELLRRVQPVVVLRAGDEQEVVERLRATLGEEVAQRLERGLVRAEPVAVSATQLRAALVRGEDPGAALPQGVLEYIRARGIYAARPSGR